jgi:hypothetical protein
MCRRREDLSADCKIISNGKQIATSLCLQALLASLLFVILPALAALQNKNPGSDEVAKSI